MFENQKIILRRNNSNLPTKPQQINISNPKEKDVKNISKKISIDHREFGHDLTNLALTVFGNGNISQNKSILKAIEIINQMPDNEMKYVLRRLESIREDIKPKDPEIKKKAVENIMKRIRPVSLPENYDYKEEMQKYREERYGGTSLG